MGQIIISNKKQFILFENKREALEWIQDRADFMKWGLEDLTQKQATMYQWLDWDYLFNPSKFTIEDLLCNINETKGYHVVDKPKEKQILISLWKEQHGDEE